MRRRRFRWDMRNTSLAAAACLFGLALLILWLGNRHDRTIDRLAAEGRLAQGRYLSSSPTSDDGAGSIDVGYEVDGVAYRTSMLLPGSGREPIFKAETIRVPRLGPERAYQVVYLPSDPATARLRADLIKSEIAVYGTAGMFAFAGLVFGLAGLFLLRRPKGLALLPGSVDADAQAAERSAAAAEIGSDRKVPEGRYGACRRCGARLPRSDHLQLDRFETVQETNWDPHGLPSRTRTDAHFRHLPCPRCGEAQPLRGLRNNPQMIAFIVVFVGIWAAGLYALFFL